MLKRVLFSVPTAQRRAMSSEIKKVGVVGLGLMGHGIAQIAAQSGYNVLAIEAQDAALKTGVGRIEGSLMKMLEKEAAKGKITAAEVKPKYDQVMSRISTTTSLADARDCDLIIEAIVEKKDVKDAFYKSLGPLIKPEVRAVLLVCRDKTIIRLTCSSSRSCLQAVFASNTSSLPITSMALASGRPGAPTAPHPDLPRG
jgi:NADPH-dependent 2,4-dienoyl-CoA reductase/sulfur reductase-like enzyme